MELAHLGRFPESFHVVVVVVLQDTPDDDGREFIKIQRGIQTVVLYATDAGNPFPLFRGGMPCRC